MKGVLTEIDSRLRTRLRMIIWKMWKVIPNGTYGGVRGQFILPYSIDYPIFMSTFYIY